MGGCKSCSQKYAALKAQRAKLKDLAYDLNEPRNIKPPRRGIIRKAEKEAQIKEKEQPNETNTTD